MEVEVASPADAFDFNSSAVVGGVLSRDDRSSATTAVEPAPSKVPGSKVSCQIGYLAVVEGAKAWA